MVFHWKVAIEDEAEVADDSSKLSIGIAERDCLRVLQDGVEIDDEDEKQTASVLWYII